MKIKKVFKIVIKILIILLLVISFNLIMMPKYINENIEGRIIAEMYEEELSPDLLIIGSSVAHRGISPAVMYSTNGISSYIAATTSQTAWQSVTVLEEFLRFYSPQMVILDIGFFNQGDAYSEEPSNRKLFDYMRPSKVKYRGVKESMSDIESGWSYVFPVLRYHERYKDLSLDDFKYAFYKPQVTYNGYIMDAKIVSPTQERVTIDSAAQLSLDDRSRACLKEITKICSDKGIQLLLIKTPSYNAKWNQVFEGQISDFAGENGLEYIDFDNQESDIGIDWSMDTPDEGGHLNLFGAEKFSFYLANYLSENYSLADRKQDETYREIWDAKLERYEKDKLSMMMQ